MRSNYSTAIQLAKYYQNIAALCYCEAWIWREFGDFGIAASLQERAAAWYARARIYQNLAAVQ